MNLLLFIIGLLFGILSALIFIYTRVVLEEEKEAQKKFNEAAYWNEWGERMTTRREHNEIKKTEIKNKR